MIPANVSSQLLNHLWQSTAVVAIAWLLAAALKKNHARTRYWIWLAASLKFLLPFSLLVAMGSMLQSSAPAHLVQPALSNMMQRVSQPFPTFRLVETTEAAAPAHRADLLPVVLLVLWACGALAVAFSWWRGWRQTRLGVLQATPLAIPAEIPVLASPSMHEPGVFGIVRPALLLPEGIVDRLSAAQLDAIIAHEMCHVRRRDNLTFALHMLIQTLFWFHPLVWYVKARLIEERERACDETVLQSGNEAHVYAEGILNVCKLYVEGPVACVAGVSGADLKKRIVNIMARRDALQLDFRRKLLLCAAGSLAVVLPVVLGLVHVVQTHAQSQSADAPANLPKFDVVSIKPVKGDNAMLGGMRTPDGSLRGKGRGGMVGIMLTPDGIDMTGVPVQMMMRQAFGVEDDRIIGAPGWVKSDRFDIQAKVAAEDVAAFRNVPRDDRFAMMLPVLEDRFHLKYHHEMRELPMYALVIAKGGPKLTKSADEPSDAPGPPDNKAGGPPMAPNGPGGGPPRRRMMMMGPGNFESEGVPLKLFAHQLAFILGHTVQDKTGLTGNYDFKLHFTPEDAPPMGAADNGQPAEDAPPPLFTALQEQLGLKLESTKSKVDVIVIDHIEPPTPN
ncbi:MAG TPA: M56 family metallopeptidase [Terracidiphilus sp.]|nr:M56 family metallopeptidase [Terracidiphilus sp.]